MTTNLKGRELIQGFEECRLTAYLDSGGVWTCGWGSTGTDVVEGTVWTQAQADARFVRDLAFAEGVVRGLVKPQLSSNQFSALVSFVYNVGAGHFQTSALLKILNCIAPISVAVVQASAEFPKWDKVKGVESVGLRRRRAAEQALFLSA